MYNHLKMEHKYIRTRMYHDVYHDMLVIDGRCDKVFIIEIKIRLQSLSFSSLEQL